MKKSMTHWYPRYPADYGKKTRHLSMMEHGAYALMMDYCYSTGNPIPANAEQVHRICMAFAPAEQEACISVLQQFFVLGEDGWHNDRITEELQKRNEISDKRANAARSMHEKKAANAGASAHANADTSTATATVVKKERSKDLLSVLAPGEPSFDEFWDRFGNKTSKKNALKAWSKLRVQDRISAFDASLWWLDRWKASHPGLNPIHPATFLNDRRWEDEQQQPSFNSHPPRSANPRASQQHGGLVGAATRFVSGQESYDEGWG